MSVVGATTPSIVIADDVRFQDAAKLISMADTRRQTDFRELVAQTRPCSDAAHRASDAPKVTDSSSIPALSNCAATHLRTVVASA